MTLFLCIFNQIEKRNLDISKITSPEGDNLIMAALKSHGTQQDLDFLLKQKVKLNHAPNKNNETILSLGLQSPVITQDFVEIICKKSPQDYFNLQENIDGLTPLMFAIKGSFLRGEFNNDEESITINP